MKRTVTTMAKVAVFVPLQLLCIGNVKRLVPTWRTATVVAPDPDPIPSLRVGRPKNEIRLAEKPGAAATVKGGAVEAGRSPDPEQRLRGTLEGSPATSERTNSSHPRAATASYAMPSNGNNETIALCAVAKDEGAYVDEWADYHLALGFAAIHVHDNTDGFELGPWGRGRAARGEWIVVRHHPGAAQQTRAYEDCARRCIAEGHAWAFFADVDEFLMLKRHDNVVDFASEYVSRGHLGINWRLFGTSGRRKYEPAPVTKRFQYRVEDEYPKNTYIKSIVRLQDLDLIKPVFDPHFFHRKPSSWFEFIFDRRGSQLKDTDGNVFNASLHIGPTNVAAIYHYYFKSPEEYVWKQSRGDVFYGDIPSLVQDAIDGVIYLDGERRLIPNGTIFDDSAWRILKRNVPKYAVYDDLYKGTPEPVHSVASTRAQTRNGSDGYGVVSEEYDDDKSGGAYDDEDDNDNDYDYE